MIDRQRLDGEAGRRSYDTSMWRSGNSFPVKPGEIFAKALKCKYRPRTLHRTCPASIPALRVSVAAAFADGAEGHFRALAAPIPAVQDAIDLADIAGAAEGARRRRYLRGVLRAIGPMPRTR